MKIYVIRHGETKLNVQGLINGHIDDELTPKGIEQAKLAARTLPKSIKRFYVSSLGRAKQTAMILNGDLGLPVTYSDDLREVNFGVLNGKPFLEQYQKRHVALDYDWRPSGENFDDVKTRMLRILAKIKQENKNGEALIVGHGGTIRTLHYLQYGEPLGEIENASLFNFDLDKILK
jgi:broad specificity phosphatase PhoE